MLDIVLVNAAFGSRRHHAELVLLASIGIHVKVVDARLRQHYLGCALASFQTHITSLAVINVWTGWSGIIYG
jgi:hypothetical protein